MIEINATMSASKDGGYCRLAVTGHANAAPRGEDLVCAAVSALVNTLYDWVLEKDEKRVLEANLHREAGYCLVEAQAGAWQMERMLDCFEVICYGLERLARQHPDKIRYKSGACGKESVT